jgi:hypothetical protein
MAQLRVFGIIPWCVAAPTENMPQTCVFSASTVSVWWWLESVTSFWKDIVALLFASLVRFVSHGGSYEDGCLLGCCAVYERCRDAYSFYHQGERPHLLHPCLLKANLKSLDKHVTILSLWKTAKEDFPAPVKICRARKSTPWDEINTSSGRATAWILT